MDNEIRQAVARQQQKDDRNNHGDAPISASGQIALQLEQANQKIACIRFACQFSKTYGHTLISADSILSILDKESPPCGTITTGTKT